MATIDALVEQVRDVLYGARRDLRPLEDTIVGTINSSVTALEMATPKLWGRGSWIQFEPDGEVVILAETHPASGTADVRRGQRGTTAAAHTAADVGLLEPVWPRHVIERQINDAVDNELWPYVWIRTERTVTGYSTDVTVYELDAADVDVEQVYQYDVSDDSRFWPLPTAYYEVVNSVASGVPTGGTSGKMLRLFRVHDATSTIYYTARTKPQSSAIASVPDDMLDMVVTCAAAKLITKAPAERRQRPSGRSRSREQTQDYAALMSEFLRAREQYSLRLKLELQKARRFVQAPRIG